MKISNKVLLSLACLTAFGTTDIAADNIANAAEAQAENAVKENKTVTGEKASAKNRFSIGGELRYRYDYIRKTQPDGAVNTNDNQPSKNSTLYYHLDPKYDLGNGWSVGARLLGTVSGSFDARNGQENNSAFVTPARYYVKGPFAGGTLRLGRDKDNQIHSLVNNQYYHGLEYKFGNKAKTTIKVGILDNKNSTTVNEGVKETILNPKGLGVRLAEITTAYPMNDRLMTYGGYFHTWASHDSTEKYDSTNIYELAFDYKLTKDLVFKADVARSDRDDENLAWVTGLAYRKAEPAKIHSWGLYADYMHIEKAAYIKTTYDTNDSKYGQVGWQVGAQYVPAKNFLWTIRYLEGRPINNGGAKQSFFRTQLEWFF